MSERPEHYTPQYINNQRNPFAPTYGINQQATTVIVRQKSLLIAYLLWFFLGWLGLHKLYLRQPFMALFYVILFAIGSTTWHIILGIPFIVLWGLLMFIDIFTMPIRVGLVNSLAVRRTY